MTNGGAAGSSQALVLTGIRHRHQTKQIKQQTPTLSIICNCPFFVVIFFFISFLPLLSSRDTPTEALLHLKILFHRLTVINLEKPFIRIFNSLLDR
ncbi:hypothetical protein L6164_010337 [Bauhinia variegata]|uniref:Uncharacterized protein n=1 Tax=Bauhinia variegata TaxID=167791 RepID=A0ACB9PMS7_BAUVA|nr:hypothetical protein L6164_010337 [Bauhinia variegata]